MSQVHALRLVGVRAILTPNMPTGRFSENGHARDYTSSAGSGCLGATDPSSVFEILEVSQYCRLANLHLAIQVRLKLNVWIVFRTNLQLDSDFLLEPHLPREPVTEFFHSVFGKHARIA